jgi:hypothetical protein
MKLIPEVAEITFNGQDALRRGKEVVFITERAVFRLIPEGVELSEIAPGIDIQRPTCPANRFRRNVGLRYAHPNLCELTPFADDIIYEIKDDFRMKPIIFLAGFMVCSSVYASHSEESAPPNPFVDIGACPFECCEYRSWTAANKVGLLDKPDDGQIVGYLDEGEIVEGVTGYVISNPVATKANRDIPETRIKTGDIFYVLHYDSIGYWKVWFQGEITFVHENVVPIPWFASKWWVKIKKNNGLEGWALSDKNFLHQDACE